LRPCYIDRIEPPVISLDDEEMAAVLALAEPILPSQRSAFLQALATELRVRPDAIGAGAIHRIGRELQLRFLRHPLAVEARGPAPR
jgi:hypothetical protein